MIPTVVFVAVFMLWRKKIIGNSRKNPLSNQKIRRPPGYSLQLELDNHLEDSHLRVCMLVLAPILTMACVGVDQISGTEAPLWLAIAVFSVLCLLFQLYLTISLVKNFKEIKNKQLGLDGEMFSGELLNQLMLEGCRVFHDLPYEYGNIDHIVISRNGVFAIDTKMRGKPEVEGENYVMHVDFDKAEMRFPDGIFPFKIYQSQLETQKRCLEKLLDSAVDKNVIVKSVLAFPGWYIERKGYGDFAVINPKNHALFLSGPEIFTELQVKQIAKRLDELCRDVEPVLKKRKKERWEDRRSA